MAAEWSHTNSSTFKSASSPSTFSPPQPSIDSKVLSDVSLPVQGLVYEGCRVVWAEAGETRLSSAFDVEDFS